MKKFVRILAIMAVITASVTVSSIDADHQNGSTEQVNDDCTGYVGEWGANDAHTAHITVAAARSTGRTKLGIPYTDVTHSAYFSTATMSSNWEPNTGAWFLSTGKTGPKSDNYEGRDSESLYACPRGYWVSPCNAGGHAFARVDPDDDQDIEGTATMP
ncbi:MAG: hypothetical protein OXI67_09725 [Candidatus Poribacteria bacterium]|nr:hypothetical protein [Candidatus Poribacteria bacterium]